MIHESMWASQHDIAFTTISNGTALIGKRSRPACFGAHPPMSS